MSDDCTKSVPKVRKYIGSGEDAMVADNLSPEEQAALLQYEQDIHDELYA